MDDKPQVKRIIRLLGTDINGNLAIRNALREIKGISFAFSKAVCLSSGINKNEKVGSLNEEQVKKLESAISKAEFPSWLLNRRKDVESGKDRHVIGTELDLMRREDINTMKRIKCYKGVRHDIGQPVRGQRTRGSFRSQKSVGVSKKKQMPAKKGDAPVKK